MEIKKALEILKNRHEYIVPNSDFDEAMVVAISILEEKRVLEEVNSKVNKDDIIKWLNDSIKTDKLIDEFLRKNEGKNMRKFEYVKRIEEKTFDLPKRGTKKSAGYDFINPERIEIPPYQPGMKPTLVKTGVKALMPDNEYLQLVNRSSNPAKKNLVIPNGLGIIDADYYGNPDNDGEMMFAFYNVGTEPVVIEAGDKLGQGIFTKYEITDDDAAEGERAGGFGSTGR